MKIEAKTLEEAYENASSKFNCSITDIDIEVIQNPSSGIFGMFAKKAIISASPKGRKTTPKTKKKVSIDIDSVIDEIAKDVRFLFENRMFDVNVIGVEKYDNSTVLIKFDGRDSSLLIGKDGYRYKAISYMIHNWLKSKYSLNARLEIAQFLQSQEANVKKYLEEVKSHIDEKGHARTKPLDGILIQIALKELRDTYEDKYISVKTSKDGEQYISIRRNVNSRQ